MCIIESLILDLEGFVSDQETRISDLEVSESDQETRLTAAEENIQGNKFLKVKKLPESTIDSYSVSNCRIADDRC